MISFEVLGAPAPKGSSRAMVNKKTGRAMNVPSGSDANKARMRTWDGNVRACALEALGPMLGGPVFVETALDVKIVFHMARPASHWGKGKNAGKLLASAPPRPRTKPDIDKLARATLDSLTGIVFDDDSRIADLALSKRWAAPGREGATITIVEAAR